MLAICGKAGAGPLALQDGNATSKTANDAATYSNLISVISDYLCPISERTTRFETAREPQPFEALLSGVHQLHLPGGLGYGCLLSWRLARRKQAGRRQCQVSIWR
jgi:hypothetical protein